MTIVSHVKIKEKHEPAWDAAMRERIEAAKEQPGFVAVQVCIPADAMNERVIIGTWETRADSACRFLSDAPGKMPHATHAQKCHLKAAAPGSEGLTIAAGT